MAQQEAVRYERRTVAEWVEKASTGYLTIADFQRSFVWDSGKATEYIKAILLGKPVGLYLILASSDAPQFDPRPFNNMDTPLGDVEELVLDGQQRLTSLLHALYGHPDRRFFIRVTDLSADVLDVEEVICESRRTSTGRTGKGLDDPGTSYERNLVPIDVLRKDPRSGTLSPLANWCISIGEQVPGMKGNDARLLEDRISNFVEHCLFQRDLWYCLLPSSTGPEEATDIFVATNTSSVKIKRFDIEVAKARSRHDEDLRVQIQEAYDKSEVLRHYFSDDPEDFIPDIGEWMLKVTCLHVNEAPKESSYPNAIRHLLGTQRGAVGRHRQMALVFRDLDWALKQAEGFGAATDKLVPSQPVLHVLSALRRQIEKIKSPARVASARQLVAAYYWRCLFSNRHAVQANDRLYEDFRQLSAALDTVGGDLPRITAFDSRDHPLYDEDYLIRHAGWIGTGRLGKALASAVMASEPKPTEWMTNASLSAREIRELNAMRKLDRHHVFPKAALEGAVGRELIQNGLNGVLLDRRTNLRLWKVPPSEYIEEILEETGVPNVELRSRVESHWVPYKELKSEKGTIGQRYKRFLKKRANLLAGRIEELVALP